MAIRLKEYGRNHIKRKEYIHQSGLLLAGVDVITAKHDACIGTLEVSGPVSDSGPILLDYSSATRIFTFFVAFYRIILQCYKRIKKHFLSLPSEGYRAYCVHEK